MKKSDTTSLENIKINKAKLNEEEIKALITQSKEIKSRGPRVKYVCRRAAVVLGLPKATFGKGEPKSIILSALPDYEKEKLLKKEAKSVMNSVTLLTMNKENLKQSLKEDASLPAPVLDVSNVEEIWTNVSFRKKDIIIKTLLSKDTEDSVLICWLKELKDNIFYLDKDNERIISALLSIDWPHRNQDVILVYKELILNLVSAHTIYLTPVLNMIIKLFYSTVNENNIITKEENECYQKAHALLQDIVTLVPSAPNILCSLLFENFPYLQRPSYVILRYVINMLNITTYLPSCQLIILAYLMEKILEIDVYCPRDVIETSEINCEENEELVMDIDTIEDNSMEMALPLANTLDLLMENLFNYLDCTCFNAEKKELRWDVAKKLFQEMLTIFDQFILPTHRCSHIQFLLFYMCSWKQTFCENFLDYLWKKIKNPNTAPVRRQVATFYIGSLLARASFVNMSTVTACFDLISEWIHCYISNYDSRKCSDFSTHGTFHCVCQTLFYVFAFRHKEFISMKNGFKYLRGLNFERIISCRLNPLKFCQPIIVQNFASVARNYQIVYCYPVIERNNRSLALGMLHADSSIGMKWFFPFDPYLLKRSKKWIENLYRVYTNDEQTDLDVTEEISEKTDSPLSNTAVFSYGSSPGFKTIHCSSPSVKIR